MPVYVALLRGINVGGKNLIKMADLRALFEANGFADVSTYIQSGNVLFRTRRQSRKTLGAEVEGMLSGRFGYAARAVVLSEASLRRVVEDAPRGFGTRPDVFRSDVVFLRPPLTSTRAMKEVFARHGVDEAFRGKGVVYFTRRAADASRSHFAKIVESPIYPQVTIRSWSTTTKLVGKLDELRSP